MENAPNQNAQNTAPVSENESLDKVEPKDLTDEQKQELRDYIKKLLEDEKIVSPVVEAFKKCGYPLNRQLVNMLNEGKEHQGGRKGSGYTQASRHLASYLRRKRSNKDIRIFDDAIIDRLEDFLDYESEEEIDLKSKIDIGKLHEALNEIETEEGRLIAEIIVSIFDPKTPDGDETILSSPKKEIKIGTCTTSEVYFFHYFEEGIFSFNEWAQMNILVDENNNPIMVEKVNIGESHSAITLTDCIVNGVKIPKGSLVGIKYDDNIEKIQIDKGGSKIQIKDCEGFEFLRFTTLVVSPENRERAFGEHFEFQKFNSMNGYDTLSIDEVLTQQKRRLSKIQ